MIESDAMHIYQWDQVAKEQLNPALVRQVIHSETMTVARLSLRRGALVPEHSHPNEQISMLEKGSLKFVIDGAESVARAGQLVRIPPHLSHSVEALEDSIAVDLFSPRREDWIRGDDAYLRK